MHIFLFSFSSVAEFASETNLHGPAIVGMNPTERDPASSNHDTQSSSDKMGAGTAAGITFGVTAFAGLAIAAMVIGWRRHKSVRRESDLREPLNSFSGYGTVSDGSDQRI